MKEKEKKNSVTDLIINKKFDNEIIEEEFNGIKIKIKGYLGIGEKQKLVDWVLSQSLRNKSTGLYISLDINKKFDIALVNFYTNYKFDIVNKDYRDEVYDILNQIDFFNFVVNNIPEDEYDYLHEMIQKEINNDNEYRKSIAAGIARFNEMPLGINEFNKLMDSFNKEDIKEIKNIMNNINSLGVTKDKAEQKDSLNK